MNSDESLQNVAWLIACLPGADAALLLQRLPDKQAAVLRSQIRPTDGSMPPERAAPPGRVAILRQFVFELSSRVHDSRTRHDSRDLGTGPVDFLIRQLPSQLAAVLENELPQTIAAALLGLPANQAADVLAHLSFEQQDAVACRLAEMGCVSDDTLQYLAESLAEQVAAAAQTPVERGDGPQHLRAILDYSDQATRHRLTVTVQASGLPWTQSARDLRESA